MNTNILNMSFGETANLPLLRTICEVTAQSNSYYPDLVFSPGAVSRLGRRIASQHGSRREREIFLFPTEKKTLTGVFSTDQGDLHS